MNQSINIKFIVDRIADSGLLTDCELEALRFYADVGCLHWLSITKPRSDKLNDLILVTCSSMMKKGQEIRSYREVIQELWRYEENVLDYIEDEIIFWRDKKGNLRETSFEAFRKRLSNIIKINYGG